MFKSRGVMSGPKPTKACVNCRRLKMKCEVSGAPPCRRCRHNQVPCIFKPRANASALHELIDEAHGELVKSQRPEYDQQAILNRLDRIEAALGISNSASPSVTITETGDDERLHDNAFMQRLWNAMADLRTITRPVPEERIWSRPVVRSLWSAFLENLPLLHFLKDRTVFELPTPLLLASVLYISALLSKQPDLAATESGYFNAMCCAISQLINPCTRKLSEFTEGTAKEVCSTVSSVHKQDEVFHNILGLVMATLSSEAFVDSTGSWIAIAYRLWLDHCPAEADPNHSDWRALFCGLQLIDIEHASMHMTYPLLPRQPPRFRSQRLDTHEGNAFQDLANMMHYGLSHFVGKGLPTIWCSINTDLAADTPSLESNFSSHDSDVIRLWARKLDDWLVRYNGTSQPSPSDRQGILILLQYHLHKLYVLSIYYPARGFDLSSAKITPAERHELLVSARAVLRLRQDDASIWSNWDLIMITWAAMLLLRGVEDGMTHQDDLHLIQAHLQSLERSHPSTMSIHTVLSRRLESNMQAMHTPPNHGSGLAFPGPITDESWTIFDQEIMFLANPSWLYQESAALPNPQKASTSTLPVVPSGSTYDSGLLVSNGQQIHSGAQWSDSDPGHLRHSMPSVLN
ncbi:Fungal Zn(2)-Cys(6) binuclear cluster domain-containing protein [Penicillium ucsense]|uniref:Fungal Zn(2)-Cys(6) binuclear cluster domain-containing protein n=1 Tax=Penicillium ucsense TaxID=2839758 RepID=A0A8J8WIQ8_9EURO|nr:Fungal Zn(2)-Cys(6) binuclear cluster domain-containing protein [Penicillium ucsense]KAF7737911.1 Fungal Zn(2)-Cys(6) binuclear cluster domain-containing protein [Penicillium ucsense]